MAQGLTKREAQSLLATAELDTDVDAAESLGISVQTLKNHLFSVRKKTGATKTLQAYHRLVKGVRFVTETHQRIETEE
jgi:DNA-binding CsgD family transcriptional regulator